MTKVDLGELAARVEAGSGPAHGLDAEVFARLYPNKFDQTVPRYTASLDALVALIEDRLPDAEWDIGNVDGASVYPGMLKGGPGSNRCFEGRSYSADEKGQPARALLAATLRALAAQQDRQTEG